MKEILRWQISLPFLAKFLPASLIGVPAVYCGRSLVGETGMIVTQMEAQNRS
jgi:hypothetical protein